MRIELTRRGDYAVRAMLALAAAPDDLPISVRRIAESMSIPPQILPSVMRDLVRAGLTEVVAGRSGGYRMGKPADQITLLAVVEAIEGESRRQTCVLRGGPCGYDGYCAVHATFFASQEAMRSELAAATLDALAQPLRRS